MASDTVRVPRVTGLAVLKHLCLPGSVLVDPGAKAVYFFVPSGTASTWAFPGVDVRPAAGLPLPPPTRNGPPGAYWLTAATHGPRCLRPVELLAAIRSALCPDDVLNSRSAELRAGDCG
jgi:hypothetical protein